MDSIRLKRKELQSKMYLTQTQTHSLTHKAVNSFQDKESVFPTHVRSLGQIARNGHDQNEQTTAFVLIQVHEGSS